MRLLGRGVKCVRGGREVFSELDFTATSGEALAVIGANGSGKTSLLRIVAGLLTLAAGSVSLEDGEPELTVAEQAHYLGHRDAMKPALSVLENLAFWRGFSRRRGVERRRKPGRGRARSCRAFAGGVSVSGAAPAALDRPAAHGATADLAIG